MDNNELYLHIQTDDNNVITGVSHLHGVVKAEGLYYIENKDIFPVSVDDIFGWRYISGEFLPPLPPPESQTLQEELNQINAKLWGMFNNSQFAEFIGESTPGAQALDGESQKSEKESLLSRRNQITARLAVLQD